MFETRCKLSSSSVMVAVFFLLSPALLRAQERQAKPDDANQIMASDDLQFLVGKSRSNLGQIQTWRGRARIRLERTRTDAGDEKAEEVAVGTVSFIYDLNEGNFRSDWVLDNKASKLKFSTPNQIQARFRRFNPVCWQFPMKFNIIGKSFGHFQTILDSDKKLSQRVSQRDSIVRFWLGPSEESCDIYELDIDRGASMLRSQSLEQGKPKTTWTLVPQRVDGIWVARKTTRRSVGPTFHELEVIDWFENKITRYGE